MNIKNFTLSILSLFFITTFSCKKDDDGATTVSIRDETEVYNEDIEEIEDYLSTHFYNYEAFDFANLYSAANDNFEIKFDTIAGVNAGKTPLINQVSDTIIKQNGVDYKLYYLEVREGQGEKIHRLDKASILYNGKKLNHDTFDSAVTIGNGQPFYLTRVGQIGGVVTGFREGVIKFKTSISSTTAADGAVTYQGHGIGAVFIPSGLAYFASAPPNIGAYTPIMFSMRVISRGDTDYDADGIPSHIEDIDNDGDGFNNDTDGDNLPNFVDNDDDDDGVLTKDEDLEDTDLTVDSDGDGDPTNDKDGDGDPTNDDDDGDNIPNYLDPDSTESN